MAFKTRCEMKRLSYLYAATLICFLASTNIVLAVAPQKARRSGKVAGMVFDVQDARVSGAVITFSNDYLRREITSGETGSFRLDLPAGDYNFTVRAHGFCMFEGELLEVKPAATEWINIHLEVERTHTECKCSSKASQRSPGTARPNNRSKRTRFQKVFYLRRPQRAAYPER